MQTSIVTMNFNSSALLKLTELNELNHLIIRDGRMSFHVKMKTDLLINILLDYSGSKDIKIRQSECSHLRIHCG